MSQLNVYLTTGKPGEAIALCRLDDPPIWLVRTITQHVLQKLLLEAKVLEKQKKPELARIKLKNLWMLRSTLESLLPDIQFDKNGTIKEAYGSLLHPKSARQGRITSNQED